MKAGALSLVLALAASVAVALPPEDQEGAAFPARNWREGPVRYLLTRGDYLRYGKVRTLEARRAFVERFWGRWDPDPTTLANEFRDRFERRTAEANSRFGRAPAEGWRTDRGRVLILLGEPDIVRRDAGDPRSVEREVWVYRELPGRRGSPLEITFYRGARESEYRLDPVFEESVLDRLRSRASRYGPRRLSRSAVEDLQESVAELVRRTPFARTEASPSRHPSPRKLAPVAPSQDTSAHLEDSAWFFKAADGSVLALFALQFRPGPAAGAPAGVVPLGGGERLVATVEAEEQSSEGESWNRPGSRTAELEFLPEVSGEGRLVFCGKLYLEPGASCRLHYAVVDPDGSTFVVRSRTLTVPELGSGELGASSVVPAERFGPLGPGEPSRFAVGSEEVVPRIGGAFHRGEPLRIYLQVYGAVLSEDTARPELDIVYRFERWAARGFKRHGAPLSLRGAVGLSLGLALPVGDWPTGVYRVVVDVRDRLGGQRTTTDGTFSIVD